jgi:hypothetical protein
MKLAIVAGTDAAIALAIRLLEAEPEAVIVSTREHADPRVRRIASIREFLGESFAAFDAFAFIGALGICVRSLAPHLVDKRTDPAVVNLDEAGRHVQAVLSGHLGGANALARRLAHALGAEPVITTASDAQELWPLDLLGRSHGWTPSASPDFNAVIARFVNRRPTALLLEVRDRGTDFLERTRPDHVAIFQRYEEIDFSRFELLVAVTYRHLAPPVPCLQLWRARAVRRNRLHARGPLRRARHLGRQTPRHSRHSRRSRALRRLVQAEGRRTRPARLGRGARRRVPHIR